VTALATSLQNTLSFSCVLRALDSDASKTDRMATTNSDIQNCLMIDSIFVLKLVMDDGNRAALLMGNGSMKLYILNIVSMGKGSIDILLMDNNSMDIVLIGNGFRR
jgi:hypothetical protein